MSKKAQSSVFAKADGWVGRSLSRTGAKPHLAGRGRYTDDVTLPRMLHAAFVRSPYAHARILRIEVDAAQRQPGIALVLTGADLAKLCTGPWIGTLSCFTGMKSAPQYPMAVERACWAGEPVAIVVGRTRAEAEDAAEHVRVDWEELPAVADKKIALDRNAAVIHAELGDNLAFRRSIETGEVETAFASADLVVEETFDFGRHTAVSLEPRSLLAAYDQATGKLTITTSSQCPHMIQRVFAQTLGIPDHNVQIIAPDVGGSFGLKIHSYGDEVATAAAAIQLGRPVKFIADRLESFVSDIHARENSVKARIAVTRAGEILAFDIDVLSGAGAYSQYPRTSVFEANQILNITGGPYRHKHYRARATVVYLNKAPSSQYRAVGHPIGIAVGEHLVDQAAYRLGIDPIEMRRRNVFPDDAYPVLSASGIKLKDLSHQRCLDVLVERMRYASPAAEAIAPTGHRARYWHRRLHQGHRARSVGLLRQRRRTDLLAGCLRDQARAQRGRYLRRWRDRTGPGHQYHHGSGGRHRARRANASGAGHFRRHRRGALRRRHLRFTRSSHRWRGRLPGGTRP